MGILRQRARKIAREAYCIWLQGISNFDPGLRCDADLEWLLILTMPNSGSTALGKLLMTAKAAIALTERCEGEWLVPSMSNLRTRWDANHLPSMARVRARWMSRLRRTATGSPRLVIEKSPANMVRIDWLRAGLAPMKTQTIILVRDPYAVCESWHRRYGRADLARTSMPELVHAHDDASYFRLLGERWVRHASVLAGQRRYASCIIRYEDLAAEPEAVLAELATNIPLLTDVDPTARVAVKDYDLQQLRNMNDEQIAALDRDQIAAISSGLERGSDVVTSFGYAIR